jgi:hypothetical protein
LPGELLVPAAAELVRGLSAESAELVLGLAREAAQLMLELAAQLVYATIVYFSHCVAPLSSVVFPIEVVADTCLSMSAAAFVVVYASSERQAHFAHSPTPTSPRFRQHD